MSELKKPSSEEIAALLRREGEPGVVIKDFCAQYESGCSGCGATIYPGDRAGYVDGDDQASCWDCCSEAREERA